MHKESSDVKYSINEIVFRLKKNEQIKKDTLFTCLRVIIIMKIYFV